MKLICTKSRAQNRESLKDNESYRSLKPYQVALHFAILKKYTRSGGKCVTFTNQAKRARDRHQGEQELKKLREAGAALELVFCVSFTPPATRRNKNSERIRPLCNHAFSHQR